MRNMNKTKPIIDNGPIAVHTMADKGGNARSPKAAAIDWVRNELTPQNIKRAKICPAINIPKREIHFIYFIPAVAFEDCSHGRR